jgi:hypothetical protein
MLSMELNNTTTYRETYSRYNKVSSIISVSERTNSTFSSTPFISLEGFDVFIKQVNSFTRLFGFNFTYLLSEQCKYRKEELYAF